MIAVDSNVLIAAHRREHSGHESALRRLSELAESAAPWGLPIFCIGEFLRVVTHPRVFSPPSSLAVACAFVDRLIASPSLRLLLPTDQFWDSLRQVVVEGEAGGNLVFDAQIATVCRDSGVRRLLSWDRDFARFRFLDVERP